MQNVLQNELNNYPAINENLKALFASSTQVTQQEFRRFSQTIMTENPNLDALEWIAVNHTKPFLSAAKNTSDQRPFLITYQEPSLAGVREPSDQMLDELTTKTLQAACDSGNTLVLIDKSGSDPASAQVYTYLYTPIYSGSELATTLEQRREQLLGFVATRFSMDKVVHGQNKKYAHLELLLKISYAGQTLINEDFLDPKKIAMTLPVLEKSASLQLADRLLHVSFRASPQFYGSQYLWNIWWLILSAFLINGFAGLGLLMLTGRNLHTENIVKMRTKELEQEIGQRKRILLQRNNHNLVLKAIVSTSTLPEILTLIVKTVETYYPDCLCSILLADEENACLRLVSATSLPDFYNQAIDGTKIADGIGCCGTAAFTGRRTIVEDIQQHPYWQDFADVASQAELAACWAEPIMSSNHQVLATIAIYHRQPYYPDEAFIDDVVDFAKLASIAIEKKQSEERIANMAFFDALTNLPNRRLFLDRLDKVLAKGLRHKNYGALLFLDLDHFKALNDNYGHDIGDELLIQVANRLKACVRDEDTVARLGGDEFVILMDCNEATQELMLDRSLTMGERVQRALQKPYQLKDHPYQISSSIGVTLIPQPGVVADELLKQADTAMYHAKNLGRNNIRFFSEAMQKQAEERIKTESELQYALHNKQLCLLFHPQFDSEQNLLGAEVLLHWQHPVKGLLPLEAFIDIAEEAGFMPTISDWWLKQVCLHLQQWPKLPYLSVKLSPSQFNIFKLSKKFVASSAQQNGILKRLMLEVSATAIFDDIENNLGKLQAITKLNIATALSIDDFSTCCLSLSYLKTLPISQIKVNQNVICNIEVDALIVETMTAMANHFGLSVVAEQIETAKQLQFLKEKGCNGYQGHFFGQPMTAEAFAYAFSVTEDINQSHGRHLTVNV
jgi:diguanylate cyclase (GGDEF)-like protein